MNGRFILQSKHTYCVGRDKRGVSRERERFTIIGKGKLWEESKDDPLIKLIHVYTNFQLGRKKK